jgi:hypothetical protein
MNANIITSRVPRLSAISLILLAAFSLAGRAQAQPIQKTQTSTGQVVGQQLIDESSSTTSDKLGTVPGENKSGHNFWFRTPAASLRPFNADFGADTPITINRGWVAADVGFGYNYRERTKNDVRRTLESWDLGYSTLKLGVLNNADFEVGIPTWRINDLTMKDQTGEDSRTRSGFGNVTTRFKYNLFGNDILPTPCTPTSCGHGVSALSVSADMIWPTATCGYSISDRFRMVTPTQSDNNNNDNNNNDNTGRRDRRDRNSDNYEGGLSLQYSYSCGCGMQMRINSGFILSESDRGCWNSCFGNRISLSQTFAQRYSALVAFDTRVSTERRSEWQGSIQAGFVYQATPNLQLYLGSGFGVTDRANDYSPNIHLATRF